MRQEYQETQKAFKSAVTKAKSKEWTEIAAACDTITKKMRHKLLWGKVKRTKPNARVPAASFPDETRYTTTHTNTSTQ